MDVAYLPVMCQHCDDAPCIAAAKNGAVTKRPDGIVHIDPVKAKGQKAIADACPYGAVRWNEELNFPSTGSSTRTCSTAAGRNHAALRCAQPGRSSRSR